MEPELLGVGIIKIGVEWTLDRRVDQSVSRSKLQQGEQTVNCFSSRKWPFRTRPCIAGLELNVNSFFSEGVKVTVRKSSFLKFCSLP